MKQIRHPTDRDNPIAVVDRIASIVNCVAQWPDPISISELARQTQLPKSTVSRIVHSMIPHGLLELQEDGLVLGLRFFELGERASRPRTLRRLAYAHMEHLRRVTSGTVSLGVLDGPHVVLIEVLRARDSFQGRVGERQLASETSLGQALLAFSPPARTEALIAGGGGDVDKMRATLWRVRAEGLAHVGDFLAAPILLNGEPIAAICVAYRSEPEARRALDETIARLNRQAAQLPRTGMTL